MISLHFKNKLNLRYIESSPRNRDNALLLTEERIPSFTSSCLANVEVIWEGNGLKYLFKNTETEIKNGIGYIGITCIWIKVSVRFTDTCGLMKLYYFCVCKKLRHQIYTRKCLGRGLSCWEMWL